MKYKVYLRDKTGTSYIVYDNKYEAYSKSKDKNFMYITYIDG